VRKSRGSPTAARSRGSIYHHFPQGKEQLAQDAIRWTSEHFIDPWRQAVITSKGAAGSPVAGVAVDTLPEAKEPCR